MLLNTMRVIGHCQNAVCSSYHAGDALFDVEEVAIGTNSLNPNTDGDGFDDGEEFLELGTRS